MNAQDLKNSILQLAVQGKLVEQRPEEGTAKELLAQIKAEKEQLIKDKKIKKEKPLPEIAKEEIPFDIPESWEWVRWGDLSYSIQYGYNAPALETGTIKMVRISDIQDNEVLWDTVPYCEISDSDIEVYLLEKNDILFARTGGTVGKSYLVKDIYEKAVYAGYLIRTRYSSKLVPQYLKLFMESQLYWQQLRNGTIATAQPNCNGKTLAKMILPVPPLEEQKRIVAKIEEILPYIEQYDKAYTKLEAFNKKFPENMKKSILQMAMQGKLVEQRPEEGTADKLYEQIVAEKARLIKEDKIKKEKLLAEITEEEIPFDIPESWKWVRLGECVSIKGGKRLPQGKSLIDTQTSHIYIRVTDMKNQSIDTSDLHYIDDETYEKIKNYIIEETDLYIVIVGSTIGKVGAVPHIFNKMNLTENAARIIPIMIDKEFLLKYLMSDFAQRQFVDKTKQVGQPKLAMNRLENTLVPLPPLAEQKRIVAKLEQMLPYCEQLMK